MEYTTEKPLHWDEFTRVDIRIGTIVKAEVFKAAKRPAYKLAVNFGKLGIRKSSAQITKRYSVEELIGKQVVAVINFPPKQIATMMSECLVLGAVGDENEVILIQPERTVKNGLRIG